MKVRKGFVSNSSSSSFVCDLTGEAFETYEGLDDREAVQCEKGHVFFYEGYPEVEKWVESDDNDDDDYGRNYNMPSELCPICNGDAKTKKALIERLTGEIKRLNQVWIYFRWKKSWHKYI